MTIILGIIIGSFVTICFLVALSMIQKDEEPVNRKSGSLPPILTTKDKL